MERETKTEGGAGQRDSRAEIEEKRAESRQEKGNFAEEKIEKGPKEGKIEGLLPEIAFNPFRPSAHLMGPISCPLKKNFDPIRLFL